MTLPAETRNTDRIAGALLWLAYSTAVIVLSVYHEPWKDELIAWDIAVSNTPAGVFSLMAREGHFCVWHFMLYPFAQAGMSSLTGLSLVSSALMIAAAWLLIYRSPFGLWCNLLILASYPALYYFPVVSRVYALIPLSLWLVAICHRRRSGHPVLYGLSLGLLINTHIYMEGLALALLVWWVLDAWKAPAAERGRAFKGVAVAVAAGIFALSQIVGNLFRSDSPAGEGAETIASWIEGNVNATLSVLNAVPVLQAHQWAVNTAGMLILAAMAVWYCRMLRRHPRVLLVVGVAILFQLAFALLVYNGLYQRRYLIYFTLLFGFWLAGSKGRQPALWLLVLLAAGLPMEIHQIKHDLNYRYSDESYVSELLRNDPHPVKYIGMDDWTMHEVVYCFGKPPVEGCQFRDLSQMLESVGREQPDSFLLCQKFDGGDLYGDSCNTAVASVLSDMGYVLEETSRYHVNDYPLYLNSYRRSAGADCARQPLR